jgi:hypothetical protein
MKCLISFGDTASTGFIPDKYMNPTTTWVYGDNVAIVAWSAFPIATLIRSKDIANSFRSYFELRWKQAKD